ncbi:hypothetical protein ABPG74_019920 [Tetrahymena malaccensis]
MGKEEKKVFKDRCKYENTQQTETYRQQLTKEKRILQTKTQQDIERLDPYFTVNNNYLGLMKKDAESGNQTSVQFKHPLDQLGLIDNDYCQKCKKDASFCPHKNKNDDVYLAQNTLKHPVTHSQTYGWRPPIDDSNWGYGLKSTIQAFTTSFRNDKPKEPTKTN